MALSLSRPVFKDITTHFVTLTPGRTSKLIPPVWLKAVKVEGVDVTPPIL